MFVECSDSLCTRSSSTHSSARPTTCSIYLPVVLRKAPQQCAGGVHHPSSSSIIVSTSHSHSRVQVQVIGNVETVEKNMLPKASPVKRSENTPKGLNCQQNILNSNNVLQNSSQNRDLVDKWLTKTKRELSVIQYESTT